MAARARAARLQTAWRNLTDQQRAGWNTLAATTQHTNRLGERRPYTGNRLFIGLNAYRLLAGAGPLSNPPIPASFTFPTEYAIFTLSGPPWQCLLNPAPNPAADYDCLLYAQRLNSTTTATPLRYWRILGKQTFDNISSTDVAPLWRTVFPDPATGEAVALKLLGYNGTNIKAPTLVLKFLA